MKRLLTFAAAALITSASAFAGWGPNGQYGNAIPGSKPVGQSSTPSTHPASAPILNPVDPTKPSDNVPGSDKDRASKGLPPKHIPGGWGGYNPNSPMYDPNKKPTNTTSARPPRQRPFPTTQTSNNYPQYPNHSQSNSGWGGDGNEVLNRPHPTNNYPQQYPTNMNHYPQQTQYPSKMNSGYPQGNSYPQHTTSSNSGWGGNSTAGSSWGPVNSGYGGQTSTSTSSSWGGYGQSNCEYGMFSR
jgi:hypothetical protein